MKVLVLVKRVIDYNVKVPAKADGLGVVALPLNRVILYLCGIITL